MVSRVLVRDADESDRDNHDRNRDRDGHGESDPPGQPDARRQASPPEPRRAGALDPLELAAQLAGEAQIAHVRSSSLLFEVSSTDRSARNPRDTRARAACSEMPSAVATSG